MNLPFVLRRARGLPAAAGALLCALIAGASHAQSVGATVGPNILVSRDGDVPHVEIMAAANPHDPRQLLAGSITATSPVGGWATKTYASIDGGATLIDSSFPEQVENGGADPQTAYTEDGAALFATLGWVKDEHGRMGAALLVYRSQDGGRTWSKPVVAGVGLDHPQIVVDHTGGKHNGRIYIGYLHNGHPKDPNVLEYLVSVVRSDDGGRSFGKPVLVASGKGVVGINVVGMHVLGDGTLAVPYIDFDYHQQRTPPTEATSHLFVATSSDGGETYSEPKPVGAEFVKLASHLSTFPAFTGDTTVGKYRDRMYGVWTDFSSGDGRVVLTWSNDHGATWSKPVPIDGSGAPGSAQYQGQVAVNDKGVVGVAWLDTRSKDLEHYDEYFTASTDGGQSFMKPVRMSSQTSDMLGAGNVRPFPLAWHYADMVRVSFVSPATRWRAAGDYLGLVADSKGVFHPVWADSRTGTGQVWTAAVEVGAAPDTRPAVPADAQVADVTGQVDVITDPVRYDATTRVLELPMRLQNRTGKTLYGPITVVVSNFGSGMGEINRDFAPELLNATNRKSGAGEMDYTSATGDAHALAPDAVTDAVVWRLKVDSPETIPDMHLAIKAAVQGPPARRQGPVAAPGVEDRQ